MAIFRLDWTLFSAIDEFLECFKWVKAAERAADIPIQRTTGAIDSSSMVMD